MFDVHATEEEDRLVLLCAMNELGGCTEEQLLRFTVETELQSQFQFFLALSALKEAGFVRSSRRLEGTLLYMTPEGRQCMEMFASRIRASQQEKLEQNGAKWRVKVRDELSMPTRYEQTSNGYAVTMRALEAGEEIFTMTLTAATKEQAKLFCARWPQKASEIYRMMMKELGETVTEEPSTES